MYRKLVFISVFICSVALNTGYCNIGKQIKFAKLKKKERKLKHVFFRSVDSLASEFYMPTFQNILSVPFS